MITGWDGEALALGFGIAAAIAVIAMSLASARAEDEAGAHVSALLRRRARAWPGARSTDFFTNPALLLPSLIFPLFFFTAFAGGLSRVGNVPGFDFPTGYTAFQFVFVLLQSAAFGGVFTGFGIARDFESGFARRLHAGRAEPRAASCVGYTIAALARALIAGMLLYRRWR